MAERVVTTEAVVVAERPSGEAAKVLTLFTRDLGLIYVHAAGIRYLKSKLRYHTQLHCFFNASVVSGREYWRLVGAEAGDIPSASPAVCALLTRFAPPEVPHVRLFEWIRRAPDDTELALAIFDEFGYVGETANSLREADALIKRAVLASHL